MTGVVCDDRAPVRRTVAGVLTRSGFTVAAEAQTFSRLRALVISEGPTVAVLTLPLTGMTGLAAVRALRAEAPGCEVVLLSSFDQLTVAAVEAGATALVAEDDPQALHAVVLGIAARSDGVIEVPAQRPQPAAEPDVDPAPEPAPTGTGSTITNPSS